MIIKKISMKKGLDLYHYYIPIYDTTYIPIYDTTLELSVFWQSDTESRIKN